MTTTATTDARAHNRAVRRLGLGVLAALALSAATPSICPTTGDEGGPIDRAATAIAVTDAHAGQAADRDW
jgi:hypothetical protein